MTLRKLAFPVALLTFGLSGCGEGEPTEPNVPAIGTPGTASVQRMSADPLRPFRLSFSWPHDPSGGVCTVTLPDGSSVEFAARIDATGNATHMGRVSSRIEVLDCGFDAARARLTQSGNWRTYAANGDYIGGHWSGYVTLQGRLVNRNVIDYGTGRFRDARGESDCGGMVQLGVGGQADCTGWMTY